MLADFRAVVNDAHRLGMMLGGETLKVWAQVRTHNRRGPRRIVLVRLSDGKLVSFQPRPGATALVGARLTESGLFYAYNTRSRARPGRIVFAPTRKLLRRF